MGSGIGTLSLWGLKMKLSEKALWYVAASFVESDNHWQRQLHAKNYLVEAENKITAMTNLELIDLIGEMLKEEAIDD